MTSSNTNIDTAGNRVTFESQGETIVGCLFQAAFGDGPAPAVVIIGPMTSQKEQAPLQYAQRMSQLGYTALIFDTRYRGESGGEPRCQENPIAKLEDLRAATQYLASRSDVDSTRITLLGICFGGSYALRAAVDDPLIRVVATVAGHFRDHAADVEWLGSEDAVAERLTRGQKAQEKYETTDEVDVVPAVDHDRMDVGMPGELVWSWYQLWADRGLWENKYAVMSDAAVFTYDSISAAARLTKPLLMIHSDLCAIPDAAKRHFAVVPTADKQLIWEGETRHLQYYDDPEVIYRASCHIVDWFSRHLGTGHQSSSAQNVDTVRRFFGLLGEKDIATWGELWDESGKITVPYPADGFPDTIAGKSEIVSSFKNLFENFDRFEAEVTGVYPTPDAVTVSVEYRNRAMIKGGTEYTNDNIAVFRFRDGLITEYHDYFDPRRFQIVVDALPQGQAN
jgi:ketosteroid isomerase-like protein/dienelactone hydrolase